MRPLLGISGPHIAFWEKQIARLEFLSKENNRDESHISSSGSYNLFSIHVGHRKDIQSASFLQRKVCNLIVHGNFCSSKHPRNRNGTVKIPKQICSNFVDLTQVKGERILFSLTGGTTDVHYSNPLELGKRLHGVWAQDHTSPQHALAMGSPTILNLWTSLVF